ncbi:MAG: C39 family peptidase [Clostridia bacterium]|nr:C39 family peptidase [Clostridia bacterium]
MYERFFPRGFIRLVSAVTLLLVGIGMMLFAFSHDAAPDVAPTETTVHRSTTTAAMTVPTTTAPTTYQDPFASFLLEHGLSIKEYPLTLLALLLREPEAESFVQNYPLLKGQTTAIDLSAEAAADKIPLLLQWDSRWGYKIYGSDVMGLTGCGPTCLSMIAIGLLHDASLSPAAIADFAVENNYCVPGNGTAWTLMDEGAARLGLSAESVGPNEAGIAAKLNAGHPMIFLMYEGDFTTDAHFIVVTGYQNGVLTVNDPNSPTRSAKTWNYADIESQIAACWAYSR